MRDQRAKHRFQVAIRAVVINERTGEEFSCAIRDGSISGCKIVSSQVADFSEQVLVKVPKLEHMVRGRIVWRDERAAGIEFNWEASQVDERRDAPRREVLIPVVISDAALNKLADGTIMDASRTGCRIFGDKVQELPDRISLEICGLTGPMIGQIVWRNDGMAGVKFLWESEVYALDDSLAVECQ